MLVAEIDSDTDALTVADRKRDADRDDETDCVLCCDDDVDIERANVGVFVTECVSDASPVSDMRLRLLVRESVVVGVPDLDTVPEIVNEAAGVDDRVSDAVAVADRKRDADRDGETDCVSSRDDECVSDFPAELEREFLSVRVGGRGVNVPSDFVVVDVSLTEVDRVAVRSGLVNEMVSDATEDMV